MRSHLSVRRVFWAFFTGLLLAQTAWILTMPTYRGIDEFDHVFHAAAVARGEWTDHGPAENGRGGYVRIPKSIVDAATSVCEYYEYTGRDNCRASRTYSDGDAQIATAAGAYNPTYYVVVGAAALPFGGAAADYVMRAVTAAMCALLLAWAASLINRWARTPWPLVVFSIGITPVMLYSTTIASPNGLTYSGAALVWSALIAATRQERSARQFALPATVGAFALLTTHTTGSLWLVLICLCTVVLLPLRSWLDLLKRDRKVWGLAATLVLVTTLLCAYWVRFANTNALGPRLPGADTDPLDVAQLATYHLLWLFQSIATFPTLDEPPPTLVYALWGLPLAAAFLALARRASGRVRVSFVLVLIFIVVVPSVLTVISYPYEGLAWQGRYSLPLWIGIAFLAGVALDNPARAPRRALIPAAYLLMAIATAVSTVSVGRHEVSLGPSDPAAAGFPAGFLLVGLLAVVGILLPLRTVMATQVAPTSEPRDLSP